MMYTKELIFNEFKEVTKKDQKKKKEIFTNRIEYLKCLKEDMIKVPKNFSNLKLNTDQLQRLIDDWSTSNPRDAMYMRVFGMTFAEKKESEELEYMNLNKAEREQKKKEKEKVTIQ